MFSLVGHVKSFITSSKIYLQLYKHSSKLIIIIGSITIKSF